MIEAAIVGLGRWGRRIVESVQGRSNRVHIRRGMVRHPEAAKPFARQHVFDLTDDFDALLVDKNIDAVLLATPHTLHAAQTIAAAAAGKHVFCEKPLTLTHADAARAVRACADAHRVLAVGHDKRFWPSMIALHEVVASGVLGAVLHVEGHTSNENAAGFAAWRDLPDESPAGGMTGAGIHMLDALVGLAGPVTEVHARHTVHRAGRDPRDAIAVLLAFANGVSGTLATVRSTPFYWRAHVFGDRGSAEALGPTTLLVRGPGGSVDRREFAPVDQVLAEVDAFADAVMLGRPYPVTPDDMLATVAAFEAIVQSVKAGRSESVAAS
jgi:predicted dehydrogenase